MRHRNGGILGYSAALWVLSTAIVCLVLASWIASVLWGGVNSDAGYYVPQALLVLGGDRPYVDFPSSYPPGIYYLLGLLGESLLRSPVAIKCCVLAVQLMNSLLVFGILRRLGSDQQLATLFTALFAGLTTAAWGMAIELEPFQNLFVLSGFWLLLQPPHVLRGLSAGLLLGAALMIKQYAIFMIPSLLLTSLAQIQWSGAAASPDLRRRTLAQTLCFLAAVPIPYLAFVSLNGLNLVDNILHLATFGGQASAYGSWGLEGFLNAAFNGSVGRFLLPTLAMAGWLVIRRASLRVTVLTLGLVLGCAPLYIRPFDYYFQLILPWSIFVMAEFTYQVGQRLRDKAASRALVAALIVLPMLGIIWDGARLSLQTRDTRSNQLHFARQLEAEIENPNDVLVLDGSWLYVLTRFVPPLKDYTFTIDSERDVSRRANARSVIVFGGRPNVERVLAWLKADGLRLRRRMRWNQTFVYVWDRPLDGLPHDSPSTPQLRSNSQ